ncbi:polysaccharide pyruvyl transferase family protein [Ruminococcus sp.]|uniref:polysaccharide pyruvyl transferase family protein n=1 Tax=Ruminococcus sp. TaxID=41978 RepID=UPI0025D23901|nr:polysaccharide pyruvyl transferase family protein [Ruminococcus sp.]MBQ8966882.1 polysaccharide pyruvyl transferase family protein [Ruminococcus sp.]
MKKHGLKILLVCIVNRNYGDGIIADCTEYLVRRALGEDNEVLRYKVDCGDLWQIQFADAVVFAGGGMIKFRQEDFYLHTCSIIEEAQKYGIPVFMNAVGVEGFDGEDERCLKLKEAINLPCVEGISVRDDVKLLKEKYISRKGLRIKGVYDPAVWAGRIYGFERGEEEVIGLNVARGGLFPDYGRPDIDEGYMLDFWCGVMKLLDDRGLQWKVFTNGGRSDEEFAEKLIAKAGRGEKLAAPAGADRLVRNISEFSGMIAVRMHACITAYSLGIPCVGLIWNDKLDFWGKKTGQSDLFIPAEGIKAETAVGLLEKAMKRRAPRVSGLKRGGIYRELERFLKKYAQKRNVRRSFEEGQIFEVGLGGIGHRLKAPNSTDELARRLEEGCRLFEADVRAAEDGRAVCINGWTEKNLSLLGLRAEDYPRKELPAEALKKSRLDGVFTMGDFEEAAGLITGYDGAKVIIDVGLPPADLKEALFADIAGVLKKTGLEKRAYIRLQREGDIKLWKKQKCPCEMIYFLADCDDPEEKAEKRDKAFEVCERYGIKRISLSAKAYDKDNADALKSRGIGAVVFSCGRLGDAFEVLEKGAEMVGSFYYSAEYCRRLLK